jgi:general secretion pathway protein G
MNYKKLYETASTAREGMTLIEIMIVVMIIGILVAVAVPNFKSYINSSRKRACESTLRAISGGIDMFNAHTGRYPQKLDDLNKKPAEEAVAKKWEGPYLKGKEIKLDPFGERYVYKITAPGAEHPYELYSYGPNKKGSPKGEHISVWDL